MPKLKANTSNLISEQLTDFQYSEILARSPYDISSGSDYAAYASASDVAILCRNLLNGEDGFSFSSSPSIDAINTWLSSGCSIIESRLASDGYVVPISQDALVFGWLRDLNALFCAANAEYSRLNISITPGERTRGQLFEDRFWKQLDSLCEMDLTTIGAVKNDNSISSMSLYVGGTKKSNKESVKNNYDRVDPRFSKGLFNLPNTNHNTED